MFANAFCVRVCENVSRGIESNENQFKLQNIQKQGITSKSFTNFVKIAVFSMHILGCTLVEYSLFILEMFLAHFHLDGFPLEFFSYFAESHFGIYNVIFHGVFNK